MRLSLLATAAILAAAPAFAQQRNPDPNKIIASMSRQLNECALQRALADERSESADQEVANLQKSISEFSQKLAEAEKRAATVASEPPAKAAIPH